MRKRAITALTVAALTATAAVTAGTVVAGASVTAASASAAPAPAASVPRASVPRASVPAASVPAASAAPVAAAPVLTAGAQVAPVFGYHKVRTAVPKQAGHFRVTSPDLARGTFPAASYANAFGCTGGNVPPRLSWSGAPAGTRSFAVTMFDPDAPTGSGFWHWSVRDLPATATSVPAGAAAGVNDAGTASYLGPCPPAGDRPHHYEITVLALDVPDAGVPATASPALASFSMGSHVIAYARITATATPTS